MRRSGNVPFVADHGLLCSIATPESMAGVLQCLRRCSAKAGAASGKELRVRRGMQAIGRVLEVNAHAGTGTIVALGCPTPSGGTQTPRTASDAKVLRLYVCAQQPEVMPSARRYMRHVGVCGYVKDTAEHLASVTCLELFGAQRLAYVAGWTGNGRLVDSRRRVERCAQPHTSEKQIRPPSASIATDRSGINFDRNSKLITIIAPSCAVTVQIGMPARVPSAASLAARKQLQLCSNVQQFGHDEGHPQISHCSAHHRNSEAVISTYGGDAVDAGDALLVQLLHAVGPECGVEHRQAGQPS